MTMTTKFYSATDGKITVFRANASGRNYQSALKLRNGISFSATPANLMEGAMPAIEITKAEYQALVALKIERLKAAGGKGYTTPSDSWVSNASLPATKALGNTEKLGAAIQAIADEKKAAKAKARSDAKKARNANPLGHAIAAIKQAAKAPAKAAKVLTGARGRVQAAKAAKVQAPAVLPLTAAEKAASKARKTYAKLTAKAEKVAAKVAAKSDKPTPRGFTAAMVKALLRKQGATRPEMQAAAGSKTMPNAHFLNLMADRFGYECYADKAPRSPDLLVYQFVLPGAKPTAYGEEG